AEKVQREEQFARAIDDDPRSQPEERRVQVDAVQAGRNDGDVKAGQGYYGVAEIENRVLGVAARDAQHQIERHNSRDRDRPQQPWPQWGDGPHTRSERSEEEGGMGRHDHDESGYATRVEGVDVGTGEGRAVTAERRVS